MEAWLLCTITPGQFSSEYVASGSQASGREFSLFVPSSAVRVEHQPTRDVSVPGKMRVELWGRKGDLLLVRLPRQTIDGQEYVTVDGGQVETREQPASPVGSP